MFGKTWVDLKKENIIGKYKIQNNPFKTPRSNEIIAKISKTRQHFWSHEDKVFLNWKD